MLAQNFKTAADMGITERLHGRLIHVLGMLEREEIPASLFSMKTVGHPECGTPGCIIGWARFDDRSMQMDIEEALVSKPAFIDLCYPSAHERAWCASRARAATALRSYLTTGEANWAEALALG